MFHTDFQYCMVDASLLLYLFMCLIMLVQKAPGKICVCGGGFCHKHRGANFTMCILTCDA